MGVALISGCSEPQSAEKTAYIADCSSDGFSQDQCSCIFDYAADNLTAEQLMASDLTHAYREINSLPEANITLVEMQEVAKVAMESMGACL
tara:strand:- start:97 stop:369 length:273 start_codon:yes stop_codon:yes gene_type:complete